MAIALCGRLITQLLCIWKLFLKILHSDPICLLRFASVDGTMGGAPVFGLRVVLTGG